VAGRCAPEPQLRRRHELAPAATRGALVTRAPVALSRGVWRAELVQLEGLRGGVARRQLMPRARAQHPSGGAQGFGPGLLRLKQESPPQWGELFWFWPVQMNNARRHQWGRALLRGNSGRNEPTLSHGSRPSKSRTC